MDRPRAVQIHLALVDPFSVDSVLGERRVLNATPPAGTGGNHTLAEMDGTEITPRVRGETTSMAGTGNTTAERVFRMMPGVTEVVLELMNEGRDGRVGRGRLHGRIGGMIIASATKIGIGREITVDSLFVCRRE